MVTPSLIIIINIRAKAASPDPIQTRLTSFRLLQLEVLVTHPFEDSFDLIGTATYEGSHCKALCPPTYNPYNQHALSKCSTCSILILSNCLATFTPLHITAHVRMQQHRSYLATEDYDKYRQCPRGSNKSHDKSHSPAHTRSRRRRRRSRSRCLRPPKPDKPTAAS